MKFNVSINSMEPNVNLNFNAQVEATSLPEAVDLGAKAIKEHIAAVLATATPPPTQPTL